MATANDLFQDSLIQRAVDLLAFDSGLSSRVIRATQSSEKAIVALLREGLDEIGPGGAGATARQIRQLERLLEEIRVVRVEALRGASELVREELTQLVIDEVAFTQFAFFEAVGIAEAALDAPTRARVRAATFGTPFGQGPGSPVRTSSQWFRSLEQADISRIEGAIQAGFLEGDTIPGIVRRVRGSRLLEGVDGVTEITRRQARRLVRTTVNHFSNSVREEVFATNPDIAQVLKWVSTLDGRTSSICRARDGKVTSAPGQEFPSKFQNMPRLQPPDARPPAHPNCRSLMVAVLDPDGIVGERPFVTDTRQRKDREVDFRRQAREQGRPIKEIRARWARERVGRVPAETTYQEWLGRTPAKFQDEVLGTTRGKLFRQGGLTVDKFVDKTGRTFTLDELRATHASAFERAGV